MTKDLSFKKAVQRLEEIVEKLESHDLDLEEAVEFLAEGIELHKKCQEKLKSAQVKINKLLEEKADSN